MTSPTDPVPGVIPDEQMAPSSGTFMKLLVGDPEQCRDSEHGFGILSIVFLILACVFWGANITLELRAKAYCAKWRKWLRVCITVISALIAIPLAALHFYRCSPIIGVLYVAIFGTCSGLAAHFIRC